MPYDTRDFNLTDSQLVTPGTILVKQRGTKWHPGIKVSLSKDHSIHSLVEGKCRFHYDIQTQKRYASVLTGNEEGGVYPSRDEMKKLLAARVVSDFGNYFR